MRVSTAPVNAPRMCPKSSASSSPSGIAAQFSATSFRRDRGLSRCSAPATSSLPLPVGPSISTGVLRGATRRILRLTSSIAGCPPTNSGSPLARITEARAATPLESRCSAETRSREAISGFAMSTGPAECTSPSAGSVSAPPAPADPKVRIAASSGAEFQIASSPACARRIACSTSFRRGPRATCPPASEASAIIRSTSGCSRLKSATNS